MIALGIGFTSRSASACVDDKIIATFNDKIIICSTDGRCTTIQGPEYGMLYVIGKQVFTIDCSNKTAEYLGTIDNIGRRYQWKVTLSPKNCQCNCEELAEYFDEVSAYFSDASLYVNIDVYGTSVDPYNKYEPHVAVKVLPLSRDNEYIYVPFNKYDFLTLMFAPLEILSESLPYGYTVNAMLMFDKEHVKKQLLSHGDIEVSKCTASDKNK